MTRILNVTRDIDGRYEITDAGGSVIAGPFESNAAAWRALDRIDGESSNAPPLKPGKSKKVLWGRPDHKAARAARKEKRKVANAAKQDKAMKINAAKAPSWVRSVAAVKFDPASHRAYRVHQLGTFGAASEVKRIDPAQYLAEKAARGEI